MTKSMEHRFRKDKTPDRRPKDEQRAEIERHVQAFQARGGQVQRVPRGCTGVQSLSRGRRGRR